MPYKLKIQQPQYLYNNECYQHQKRNFLEARGTLVKLVGKEVQYLTLQAITKQQQAVGGRPP